MRFFVAMSNYVGSPDALCVPMRTVAVDFSSQITQVAGAKIQLQYAGVHEFSAPDGVAYVPKWIMKVR